MADMAFKRIVKFAAIIVGLLVLGLAFLSYHGWITANWNTIQDLYGLELDSYGWVYLIDLVVSLRRHRNQWRKLAENDIIEMISKSDKRRFEIYKGKICALYGHSLKYLYNRRQFYSMGNLQGS